jgi:hypothetical protein
MRPGEIIKRHATRSGVIAGMLSLVLWPTYAMLQEPVRVPFIGALLLTAAAGLAILAVTIIDLATVRRSRLARPARAFDLALGLVLAAPAALALSDLLRGMR